MAYSSFRLPAPPVTYSIDASHAYQYPNAQQAVVFRPVSSQNYTFVQPALAAVPVAYFPVQQMAPYGHGAIPNPIAESPLNFSAISLPLPLTPDDPNPMLAAAGKADEIRSKGKRKADARLPDRFEKEQSSAAQNTASILYNNPEYSDVVFKVEDKSFYAQRAVMASFSPVFKSMLEKRADNSIIDVAGMSPGQFETIMRVLHLGEKKIIPLKDICNIYEFARKMDLKNVQNMCLDSLNGNNIDGIQDLWQKVLRSPVLSESPLCEKLRNMLLCKFPQILMTLSSLGLTPRELIDLLKRDELKVTEEVELLHWLYFWLMEKRPDIQTAKQILTNVRFNLLPAGILPVLARMKLEGMNLLDEQQLREIAIQIEANASGNARNPVANPEHRRLIHTPKFENVQFNNTLFAQLFLSIMPGDTYLESPLFQIDIFKVKLVCKRIEQNNAEYWQFGIALKCDLKHSENVEFKFHRYVDMKILNFENKFAYETLSPFKVSPNEWNYSYGMRLFKRSHLAFDGKSLFFRAKFNIQSEKLK